MTWQDSSAGSLQTASSLQDSRVIFCHSASLLFARGCRSIALRGRASSTTLACPLSNQYLWALLYTDAVEMVLWVTAPVPQKQRGRTRPHFHPKALLFQRLQTSPKAPGWDCLQAKPYAADMLPSSFSPPSSPSPFPIGQWLHCHTTPPVFSQTLAFTPHHVFPACHVQNPYLLPELQAKEHAYLHEHLHQVP